MTRGAPRVHSNPRRANACAAAPTSPVVARRVQFQINGEVLSAPQSTGLHVPRHDVRNAAGHSQTSEEGSFGDFAALQELASRRAVDMANLASGLGFQVVSPVLSVPPQSPLGIEDGTAAAFQSSPHSPYPCPQRALPPHTVTLVSTSMYASSLTSSNDASLFGSIGADDSAPLPVLFPDDAPPRDGDSTLGPIQLPMPTVEGLSDGELSGSMGSASAGSVRHLDSRPISSSETAFVHSPLQPSPSSSQPSVNGAVNHARTRRADSDSCSNLNSTDPNNSRDAAAFFATSHTTVVNILHQASLHSRSGDGHARSLSPGGSSSDVSTFPQTEIAPSARTPARRGSAGAVVAPSRRSNWTDRTLETAPSRDTRHTNSWAVRSAGPRLQRTPPQLRIRRHSTPLADMSPQPVLSVSLVDGGASSSLNLFNLVDVVPALPLREVSSADASTSFGFPTLATLAPRTANAH